MVAQTCNSTWETGARGSCPWAQPRRHSGTLSWNIHMYIHTCIHVQMRGGKQRHKERSLLTVKLTLELQNKTKFWRYRQFFTWTSESQSFSFSFEAGFHTVARPDFKFKETHLSQPPEWMLWLQDWVTTPS